MATAETILLHFQGGQHGTLPRVGISSVHGINPDGMGFSVNVCLPYRVTVRVMVKVWAVVRLFGKLVTTSSHFGQVDEIYHDLLHHVDLTCRNEMLCRICVAHVPPRKHVPDHAGYTAPTRQHELDHTDRTDHTDHTDQE